MIQKLYYLFCFTILVGCGSRLNSHLAEGSQINVSVSKHRWGSVDGQTVFLYTLKNKLGMEVNISNWGAYLQSIKTPDKHGKIEDVLVGYDKWQDYYNDNNYAGPIVGRFGNRIAHGRFEIAGKAYQLTLNNGGENSDMHHLHGGQKGLHKRLWNGEVINNGVRLTYLSVDGEEGYPGNLIISVTYTLSDNNELKLEYSAQTDQATHVNLTSHTYFNLSGNAKSDIENHVLTIDADTITEVDQYLIPTGLFAPVANSPFDFRQGKRIGKHIRVHNQQLNFAGGEDKTFGGYDHNWAFTYYDGELRKQASVFEPESGRVMEIITTEPGLQFYSGNFMDGHMIGKGGYVVNHRSGLALEPQHFPDAPNHPAFIPTLLKPNETYHSISIYKFSHRD